MRCTRGGVAGLAALAMTGAASASTVNISFVRVEPHNALQNPANQFNCAVSDVVGQPTQVTFTFTNTVSPNYCSISEVYYDDRNPLQLLTLHTPLTQQGCSFTGGGANPGNLPGGSNLSPPFQSVMQFSADAVGNPALGIDAATDYLTMKFDLQPGATFQTVVNALNSGSLRLGLHVRSIGNGASDAFVSGGGGGNTSVAPVPAAASMGLAGLAGVAVIRRRR